MKLLGAFFLASLFLGTVGVHMEAFGKEIDPNKKPEPSKEIKFTFPNFEQHTLSNGLKVFVVVDREQPTVSLRLQVYAGGIADGDKFGRADLAAMLITKGAGSRNALELAQSLDGVGARIAASASSDAFTVSASTLTKHLDLVLGVFSDVVTKPLFSQEEFDKAVPIMLAGIRSQRGDASTVSQNMSRKVAYGPEHPYAERPTEESVKALTLADIREYHTNYFQPNNASLAIIGDVDTKKILERFESALGHWRSIASQKIEVPQPKSMRKGVYFIERPTSVQSSVVLTNITVPYADPNHDAVSLASDIIGLGFAGRLFKTLRETYSYTYTPFGFNSGARYANRFACGADVRNDVTDSSIIVMQRELNDLVKNPPSEEELSIIKRFRIGSYLMSFEDSDVIGRRLQSYDMNGLPFEKLKTYPQRIMAISANAVRDIAARYVNPDNMSIVVVGSADVRSDLEKFGPIFDYTLDLESAESAAMGEPDITLDNLMQKHVKALGGRPAVEKITSLVTKSRVKFSAGPNSDKGEALIKHKSPGKMMRKLDIGGVQQIQWTSGNKSWVSESSQAPVLAEGVKLEEAKLDTYIFRLLGMQSLGYAIKLEGKKNNQYVVKATSPLGKDETLYLSSTNYLIEQLESTLESPQGILPRTIKFSDYQPISGVQLPASIYFELADGAVVLEYSNSFQPNEAVSDSEFQPAAGE